MSILRTNAGIAYMRGQIYAVGGWQRYAILQGYTPADIEEVHDLSTDTWTESARAFRENPTCLIRCCCTTTTSLIYATSMNDVAFIQKLDPIANTWTKLHINPGLGDLAKVVGLVVW